MGDRAVRCTVLPSYVTAGDSLSGFKTFNVVLTKEGRLKLIDPDGAGFQNDDFCIMGTRGFMAPEQEQQRSLDARTDIYALGRTLQWILEKSSGKEKRVILRLDGFWKSAQDRIRMNGFKMLQK